MDMYSYEIRLASSANIITVDSVTKVRVENGIYTLLKEDLVLFTAPTESIVFIKVV